MINYYEALKLDRTLGLEDINKQLSQLESTWKRREITNPEKAAKMIALLIDARNVFSSVSERRRYDQELDKNLQMPNNDPEDERLIDLEKWKTQAQTYYNTQQYDLAKVSIDKALSYNGMDDNDILFALAADIYREAGDSTSAMDFINKAIVLSPDEASYYLCKGLIYVELSNEIRKFDSGKASGYENQMRNMFRMAIAKAEAGGDRNSQANALGALAYVLYFRQPIDQKQAVDLAEQARDLGGDSWGNAKKVLDTVESIRIEEENRRIEEENKRKEIEYQKAIKESDTDFGVRLESVARKFDALGDYKDSKLYAQRCREKAQEIFDKAKKESEEYDRKREAYKAAQARNKKIKIAAILCVIIIGTIVMLIHVMGVRTEKRQHYNIAMDFYESGDYAGAAIEFGKASGYKNAKKRSIELWDNIAKRDTVTMFEDYGSNRMVLLLEDGRIVEHNIRDDYTFYPSYKGNIIAVSNGYYLKDDGTVDYGRSRCYFQGAYIVAISAGDIYFAALRMDGTVVYGYNGAQHGAYEVIEGWENIVSISARYENIYGVNKDGTVLCLNNGVRATNDYSDNFHLNPGVSDLYGWENIIDIEEGERFRYHILGLKSNGTVLASGIEDEGACIVDDWNKVISVSAGMGNSVGVLSDGHVRSTGYNRYVQNDVSNWSDIVDVLTFNGHTIGLRGDGTVAYAGDFDQNDIDFFSEIGRVKLPPKREYLFMN